MKQFVKNIGIGMVVLSVCVSCIKENEFTDLEENKWINDIPNEIRIDSVVQESFGFGGNRSVNATVYFTFDNERFQEDWDQIERIEFIFIDDQFRNPVDAMDRGGGQWESHAIQLNDYTLYRLEYEIILFNGRVSELGATSFYTI